MLPEPDQIVEQIRSRPERRSRELAEFWGVDEGAFQELMDCLLKLQKQGRIVRVPMLGWCDPETVPYRVGTLDVNQRGHGFVRVRDADGEVEDFFVRSQHLGAAVAGDTVLIKMSPPRKVGVRRSGPASENRLREVRLVDVIERTRRLVKGRYQSVHNGGYVHTLAGQRPAEIYVPKGKMADARDGDAVLVRLLPGGASEDVPHGAVVMRLIDEGSYRTDLEVLCAEFELPREFPRAVADEVKAARQLKNNERWPGREDLREQRIFTIDPDDAKDFDDAISLEPLDDGRVRLGVHIADVSHYVTPGSALDQEARARSTSIYFPEHVIPMLPERLSNQLCSLRPGEDRLTKTVWMTFDRDGKAVETKLSPSVINSQRRFTYDEVLCILRSQSEPDATIDLPDDHEEYQDVLARMACLSHALHQRRHDRGSLYLDIPKLHVEMNDQGEVTGLQREERDEAHALIEEFMVAANESVARFHIENHLPLAARVHPEPDEERFEHFRTFLKAVEIKFRGGSDSKDLQRLIQQVEGNPLAPTIQLGLLRTMGHAEYSASRDLHFALATSTYCHFTSPIRRYPDLLMHQILDDYFEKRLTSGSRRQEWEERLSQALPEATELEKRAENAEREMIRLRLIRYLEPMVGQEMMGRIVSVHPFGFFVRIEENLIEGLVHVTSLGDDYYEFDEKKLRLVGTRKKKRYAIGDLVRVQLLEVNADSREISFRPVRKTR